MKKYIEMTKEEVEDAPHDFLKTPISTTMDGKRNQYDDALELLTWLPPANRLTKLVEQKLARIVKAMD